jgi:hypothetical protein
MCDVVIEAINDVRPEVRTYFLEKDESRKVIQWGKIPHSRNNSIIH